MVDLRSRLSSVCCFLFLLCTPSSANPLQPVGKASSARGDGVICDATVSIATGARQLQVGNCPLPSTIAGKLIEIPGAGPGGGVFTATVDSWVDSAHVVLGAGAPSGLANAKSTILFGDDDTAALQAAIDQDGFVALRDGATYLVRNLTWPSVAGAGNLPTGGIVSEGSSRIRFIMGGDPRYGIASPNWAGDKAYSTYPVLCQGVIFDGGNVVDDVMVDVSFASIYRNCHWQRGRRYGVHETGVTENGTQLANGRESLQFDGSDASFNGAEGLHVDQPTSNGKSTTDLQIRGGYWHDNGGYQIFVAQSAGLQLSGVHTYAADKTPSVFLSSVGFGSAIIGNCFEGDVVVDSVAPASRTATIENNAFGGLLKANFRDNASGEILLSRGNNFYAGGGIYQGYNGAGHAIVSQGDIFRGPSPFSWNGGATSRGQIVAEHVLIANALATPDNAPCELNGPMAPAAFGLPMACTDFDITKTAAPGENSITFTIKATVASAEGAGFDLAGRLDADVLPKEGALETYSADLLAASIGVAGGPPGLVARLANPIDSSPRPAIGAAVSADPAVGELETIRLTVALPPAARDGRAHLRFHASNRQVAKIVVE